MRAYRFSDMLRQRMESMYERYIREYKHYASKYGPNTAIFLLVGSFYELYDILTDSGEYQTSMKRATDIMSIANVEKKNDAPGGKNGRFAGFGTAQLHKYAAMLTRENWTVAVIDQYKDDKGKVTKRALARILSPGTHIEASTSENFYLAGLWLDAGVWTDNNNPPTFAVVTVDLTTGSVHTYEGLTTGRRDTWSSDSLLHFFQVHPPKELVVWWRGDMIDTPSDLFLRRTLGIPAGPIHIQNGSSSVQGGLEKPLVREDLLRRFFQPKSLLPLREVLQIQTHPTTERALCSLLMFLEDHFPSTVDRLRLPEKWNPSRSVYLGNHALTQLNMVTQREEDSVLSMFLRTYTPMGKRRMRQRLLYPITDPTILESLYEEIDWCSKLSASKRESILSQLRYITDLARIHRRVALGSLTATDILGLDQSYSSAKKLVEILHEDTSPLDMNSKLVAEYTSYLTEFLKVFDIEKAKKVDEDHFFLHETSGPKSALVEKQLKEIHAKILAVKTELEEWVGIESCFKLEEKESIIIVTGGKVAMKLIGEKVRTGTIPARFRGITLNVKKASSTIDIPAINTLYKDVIHLRDELRIAGRDELQMVCDSLHSKHGDTCDAIEEWISHLDVSMTIARVSEERGFCRPVLVDSESSLFHAVGLRHPLIESQQNRVEYVRHDVRVGTTEDEQGWLVYGMNASGKSSLMKATGIAVILAQCGCYVPATELRLSPFRSLFTRILNTDNLWAGLSSFAVEMTELGEALRRSDPWSLVLGDEVCSGTESMSAMSIVGGALQWLEEHGSRFIFATHLHGLQNIPSVAALKGLKIWHLQVRHDIPTNRLIYDRTLHAGPGSSLYGLEVARAMGLPIGVLESAYATRRFLTGETTEKVAPQSEWNSAVQRRNCEACGVIMTRGLEVHHIQPRASANEKNRLEDGSHMNNLRNLVVLCESCHDKHHAKKLDIGQVIQTSEGPVREILELTQYAYKPQMKVVGLTDEQTAIVKRELKTFTTIPLSRMKYDLEMKHGIKLTEQKLRFIRTNLMG